MRPDSKHPPGDPVRVPILAYHYTGVPDADEAPITVATEIFDQQMRHLIDSGYRSIGLHRLHDAFFSSVRSVVTFDDGPHCVYPETFPVLKRYGIATSVFVIGTRLGPEPFLSRKQIAESHSPHARRDPHAVSPSCVL